MLKQQLQQKLQQKLSPAQIQVIKMLEIPTLELEERIHQELEENPALEEGVEESDTQEDLFENDKENEGDNEIDLEEYMADDDIPDYKLKINNNSKDDKHESIPFSLGTTFHEFLLEQLGLQNISKHEEALAEYVIGNIDEEGYLRRSAVDMVDDIVFQTGIQTEEKEIQDIIRLIQQFDPAGVAAADLQECLLLQLERKKANPEIDLAKKIINQYFDEFSKKHYDKIIKSLSIDQTELKAVITEIVRLNPKPGNAWSGNILEKTMSIVIPDFIVEREEDGQLSVQLSNSNVPDLRVSRTYNEMLEDYAGNKKNQTGEMKNAIVFVKQKIDSARWFIDAIKQRQQTLLTTMRAIVELQQNFFIEGDETFLKPMILKDVATITGYDISTISRVSNSKYVQTEFGVFPLKFFFSEGMTTNSGEEISTREIKKILQECVESESKQAPLNDDELADYLRSKGYNIARRTVAKYRKILNIPVARLRKEI